MKHQTPLKLAREMAKSNIKRYEIIYQFTVKYNNCCTAYINAESEEKAIAEFINGAPGRTKEHIIKIREY